MSLSSVRDQDVAVRLLRKMLERGRVPNGLLFWGPGGVGKRLCAVEFAKAINCVAAVGDACDQCLSCRKIQNANHPDVAFVAPLKKARIIDKDTIEGMNEMASLRPFESKWRVFIIQEAERMGIPAQNKFLKTLEEPAGNSVFILISEKPDQLLPTIRSRCQRVRFGSLRPETVKQLLLQVRDLPDDVAESIAAVSQGQMSRALDLVDSDKRPVVLDIVEKLADGADPLAVAEDFARVLAATRAQIEEGIKGEFEVPEKEVSRDDREEIKKQQVALAEMLIRRDIMEYLYLFETWCRDQEVYALTNDAGRVFNRDQMSRIKTAATRAGTGNLDRRVAAIERTRVYLERFLKEDRVFRDLFFVLSEDGPPPGV
ncbi:MAG: DNA polymerase III subunit delta' [Candidatus Hydrogenedentes bacterium]|nr:DNA polymerase III subunit delta' [Candidatus Hydrogenedentota bacterium]